MLKKVVHSKPFQTSNTELCGSETEERKWKIMERNKYKKCKMKIQKSEVKKETTQEEKLKKNELQKEKRG
jgi:hypothetical protein